MRAAIAGAAYRSERTLADGVDPAVRHVVRDALKAAGLTLAEVDMVVTVASDTLDGMMVPIRAELAGALGKTYLNVPSSAGHAVSAAVAAIESGDARAVLVVGWGAASKLSGADSRSNQFDPFFTRPLGATPAVMADLQEQVAVASGTVSASAIGALGARMSATLWSDHELALSARGECFCDGAAAMVLRRLNDGDSGIAVTDYATASQSRMPLDGSLDPALWVQEAVGHLSTVHPDRQRPAGRVEVSAPSMVAELRGIMAAIEAGPVACDVDRANGTGGGAAGWFGPATGLRSLASLVGGEGCDAGLFVDLAGPLGEHVTGILIERRSVA
jgi:hypothetical protein